MPPYKLVSTYCHPDYYIYNYHVKVTQPCLTLCNSMDYIVHGTLQARILEWVAFPFSRGSSWPRTQTGVSFIAGGFFTNWAIREALLAFPSPIRIWGIPIQCPNPWGSASSLWLLFSLSGVWYLVTIYGCKQGISCSSDSLEHSIHNKATKEYLNF